MIAPSGGRVHPSGREYRLLSGGLSSIVEITPDEQESLLDLARTFDEMPRREYAPPRPPSAPRGADDLRPGDDFNQRARWEDVLYGWTPVATHGEGEVYWRKPGARDGHHATTGYGGTDLLYVFTTASELDPDRSYSKFAAFAMLEHHGDFASAAGDLRARGYGGDNGSPNGHVTGGGGPGAGVGQTVGGWHRPEPSGGIPPAPVLPLHCFAEPLRDFAHSIAWRKQGPADYAVWSMLALLGSLIGRRARYRPKLHDDWGEPATLWVGNIGDPSTLKTPIQDEAVALREVASKLLTEAHAQALDEWRRDAESNEPQFDRPKPEPRVCWTAVATTEKLAELSSDTRSRGLALIRDELAGLIFDLNRYHGGQGGDRQFFLQSYSGGAYPVQLLSRKAPPVTDLLITIIGGIQPGRAREIFAADVHNDDGLAARFMAIYPEPPAGAPLWIDEQPDTYARDHLREVARVLYLEEWEVTLASDHLEPRPFCRPSDEGAAIYAAWWQMNKTRLRAEHARFDGTLGFRVGKYDGLLARLILINHLLEWALLPAPDRTRAAARTVSADLVGRMVRVLEEYLLPMDERVYAAYGVSEAAQRADKVLAWLRADLARDPTRRTLTAREARRALRQDTPEAAEDAMEWLCSRNWLREQSETPRLGRGRRGSEVFDINPYALVQWGVA